LTCDCKEDDLLYALSLLTSYVDYVYLCYEPVLLSSPPPYTNDPLDESWNMWRLEELNTYGAWDITKGDPEVRIAIMDGGFDLNHEDLVGKVVYTQPGISTTGKHGTEVATCAAGGTNNGVGHSYMGYNCSLMLFYSGMPNVLRTALLRPDVINISWRGSCAYNQDHYDIIKMVTDMGITIVSASGNGNISTTCNGLDGNGYMYPGSYPEVICVGGTSIYSCIGPYDEGCENWNTVYNPPGHLTQNDKVDVVAPGFCLRTAWPNNYYDVDIGTSFASPIVAGLVGLMLSVDPCVAPGDIQEILKSTDQELYGQSVCSGNNDPLESLMPNVGLVDAYAAVSVVADGITALEYEINFGETLIWNADEIYAKDIYVHSGGTLIIENSTVVNMLKGKSIIVEREAVLYIDGSTIQSRCDKLSAKWNGIYVHGNSTMEQPEVDFEDPSSVLDYDFSTNESGIVVITNNSNIINAKCGVSTTAPGYDYDPGQISRWGGLVLIDHSTFRNVRVGIQFMKYDFENKSQIQYTTFTKDLTYDAKLSGITIWSNYGIKIEQNTFENMQIAGIRCIDYNGEISNNNTFQSCKIGIATLSTGPHMAGLTINDGNYFNKNEDHIIADGINLANGLLINKNDFHGATFTSISIDGPSNYQIENNEFTQGDGIDILVTNSTDKNSRIRYNYLADGKYGIEFDGNNSRSKFLNNCFIKESNDVYVTGMDQNHPGIISRFIGDLLRPAGNCLSDIDEQIHAESSLTQFFSYYIPPSENHSLCAGIVYPIIGTNNYNTPYSVSGLTNDCVTTVPFVDPDYDLNDLSIVRDTISSLKSKLAISPTNLTLLSKLEASLDTADQIETYLENKVIQSFDFDDAEDIYDGQNNISAYQALYGIKIKRGDYSAAETLFNLFPDNTVDEQIFLQIQRINLDRLEDPEYELSSPDKEFLYNTALSTSTSRGYASSIYCLLTDTLILPQIPYHIGERSEAKASKENIYSLLSKTIKVYPNPANDRITIEFDENIHYIGIIGISDLTGRIIKVLPINTNHSRKLNIQTSEFESGIYIISSLNENGTLTGNIPVAKLIIQH